MASKKPAGAKALAPASQTGAAEILARRLEANPKLPRATRYVMTRLASEAAIPAWNFFGHDEATVERVLDRVRQALEQSQAEISRPSATDEANDLEGIIKKARDLQRAIKTLPGDWVRINRFQLDAGDLPPVQVDVGWHSLRAEGYSSGYPLAVSDVLDWAVELAQHHLKNLPARALERRKDQPELTSFVRHLALHFYREFQQEHRTAIGHIASAVFDLSEPIDERDVEARLRTRKGPFAS